MTEDELRELLEAGEETPRREYKQSHPFTDSAFQATLIRSILAMSNVRDGAHIIIGVEEQGNNYVPTGMRQEHVDTYDRDAIKDKVGEYADPYVDFSMDTGVYQGKTFLVITVREFDEVPVICKKDGRDLARGAIYTRTRTRRPESARVSTHSDMRGIIELAVDKGMRRLQRRGHTLAGGTPPARTLFDDQIRDL
jgi:predicted HTH transcriptional regulator